MAKNKAKFGAFVFILLLFFNCIPYVNLIQSVKADKGVINPPSAYEENQWITPENAFVSDDQYAICSVEPRSVIYTTYNFENNIPSGSTINSVIVQCEGYRTNVGQGVLAKVTWDGGVSWSYMAIDFGLEETESVKMADFTGYTDWTTEKLTNENFKVCIKYYSGGCYPNQTYFVMWNKNNVIPYFAQNIADIEINSTILCFNQWNGFYLNQVSEIQIHKGSWNMVDIQSGELSLKYEDTEGKEQEYLFLTHLRLTANHPIQILRDGKLLMVNASMVQIGDSIAHITHEAKETDTTRLIAPENHTLSFFDVQNIRRFEFEGLVYSLHTNNPNDRLFSKFISTIQFQQLKDLNITLPTDCVNPETFQKWTAYVDYLPVSVTFIPKICISCLFISLLTFGSIICLILLIVTKRKH